MIAALAFFISSLLSALAVPIIIRVAELKHLMDEPDQDRKLHSCRTPTLGGVAIFIGTIFTFASFADYFKLSYEIRFLVPALLLLFFAGILDDILHVRAFKKLMIQMFCAFMVTILGSLHITNLWGIFGVSEISYTSGVVLTFLFIVSLINAYNLIDGVNGLAGGLGLIACVFFGTWFAIDQDQTLTILSFSLAGSLLGFLLFNFRSGKIFMGDTGSMIVGFIISILAVKFVENNRISGVELSNHYIKAAPALAVSVFIVPFFDMVRVFVQRLIKRQHPFKADRRHLHHILLDLGLNHIQTSTFIFLMTFASMTFAFLGKEYRSLNVILWQVVFISAIVIILTYARRIKLKDKN